MAESTDPAGTTCASGHHTSPVPAVVRGTFDCSQVNGNPPQELSYCLRCAVVCEFGGMFTPTVALVENLDLEAAVAAAYPDLAHRSIADQIEMLLEHTPRTLATVFPT